MGKSFCLGKTIGRESREVQISKVTKKYINPEDIEKDFPGLEKELKERHRRLDMKIDQIIKENKYSMVGEWEGFPVYNVPITDLLGVRGTIYCRRKGSYRYFINEMINGTFIQSAPVLCFVAGDLMLRVKWGNILYWAAKETRRINNLNCVFAGSPEKTEGLKTRFLESYHMQSDTFI